jgi:hypothetical protein
MFADSNTKHLWKYRTAELISTIANPPLLIFNVCIYMILSYGKTKHSARFYMDYRNAAQTMKAMEL